MKNIFQVSENQRDGSRRVTLFAIAGFEDGAKECRQKLEKARKLLEKKM